MRWQEHLAGALDEATYNRLWYYYLHLRHGQMPKRLDLANPVTFNEKTIWLKRFHRIPNAHVLADKVKVKDFVREAIGERYLIPTLGVYESADAIDFAALPDSFVLKANHGSGWNILCPHKSQLDLVLTRSRLTEWLRTSYYDIGKEYPYRSIEPRIICERFLENTAERPLVDYKLFCFSGEPYCVQVDLDRFTNHTRNFYDCDWRLIPFTTLYPMGTRILPRPASLDEMLRVARVLSRGLVFARIDLYEFEGRIYFGEITFHHGGGFEPFVPAEYDYQLGARIDLSSVSRPAGLS